MAWRIEVHVYRHGNGESLIPVTNATVAVKDGISLTHESEGLYVSSTWDYEWQKNNGTQGWPCRVFASHDIYGSGYVDGVDVIEIGGEGGYYEIILEPEDQDPPTFNNQTLAAKTCAPISATTSSAIQCNAFTAATAAAGGSITYTIVNVVEQGTTTSLSGWTIVSSTRRITIPANTPGGKTYEITVRATESTTGLYSDAVITQVLNKRTPTLTVTSGTLSITYPGSGTYQVTGGTYYGALSVASGNSTRASATISSTTVTVSTASATAVGAVTINVTSAATNFDNAKTEGKLVTTSKGTDSGPTFNNSSVSVTLAPTNATTSPAVNCGAFTAATAAHGGGLTYAIQSVNGGAVGSWTMTSTTSKVIKVPASTAGGTYTIVVRATEGATTTMNAGTKDATITVTVNKKAQTAPTATGTSAEYATSGSITGSASGGGGIGSLYYKSDTNGGTSYGSATTTAPSRAKTSIGTTTFVAYWGGNNYWAASGNSNQASLVVSQATPTLTFAAVSGTLYYNRSTQTIGTVTYTGDGTAYYIVSTTNSVPGASATGWTAIANNGSVPSSAATATTYYVFLKSTAGTNYAAVNPKSGGNKAISKQTPVVSTNPTKVSNWTYDKSAHNLLSGGAYKHSSSDTTAVAGSFAYAQATNAGSYTSLTWTFTPTDTTNYKTVTGSITGTVTVSPRGVTTQWGVLTWPYDGLTHSTTCGLVTGGVISGDTCTISLSGNSVGPNVGTATVTATLSNSNYTISSGGSSQTLKIIQVIPTLTFTYNPSVTTTYSAAGPKVLITASVAGTVYWGTTSASSGMTNTKAVSAGTATQLTQNTTPGTTIKVYAYFVPTDTTNYKNVGSSTSAGATSSNVTYNKATGGVTISNANPTYGTSNNLATVSNATGTMHYRVGTSGSFSTTMPTASGRNAGSYTLYYYVAESTNYTAFGTSSSPKSLTVTVGQKTGSVTISNANPTYGTSNALATVSGATGTMHYRVGTSGSFSTSIPTASGRNAGSYTLQYYIDASSDGNYTALGSSSSPKSLPVTVAKASNQITVSPTSTKVFYKTNYTQKTITVSNYKGTVTAESSNTSKVTVSPASSTSGTFTVTYVAVGSATITFTDTSTNYATSTATCTVQAKQDSVTTYGNVSTPTVTQIANFPAGGVTLTASNMSTYFSASATQTLTWESGYTSSGTVTYSWTVTSGSVASLGTTISNAASRTINCTVTATGEGSETNTKNVTSGTQVGNYVTAVQATSSNSGNLTAPHFSYANIGPGATSASPTLSGGAVYTFSSGSTLFNSSGSPSFGGTASYSRSYTLAESKNGFTAVNATSGVLTATSMGTTVTSARTSGTVTGVLTVTYTHASSYSAGGTVTSSTKSDTATCTQTANALTGLSMSVGTNPIAYNSTTSVTVTATYTSGASKNVSNLSATTYNDTSDPDIVQITKS